MLTILATLGYVLHPDGEQVLLIRRDKRPDDVHFGYHNGLGGKLEPDEDVVAGMRREIREESGLECREVQLSGTISWPGFGRGGENWFGFLFRIPDWTGQLRPECPEGTLVWAKIADVLAGRVPMWESDRHFLPLVFSNQPRVFHGVMPFAHGRAVSWSYSVTDSLTSYPPAAASSPR
ncbi:NUDIX domain-containing protein [Micromonospora sp. NPDC048898]|uniref:NUDIX hydrolase n=1 Tax=Micromonospora sp. NPDC048898 TaxID=3364260 RepID=UPI003723B77E